VFEGVCFGVFVSARHDYCNKYLRLVVARDSHKITSLKIQINREKAKSIDKPQPGTTKAAATTPWLN